MTLKDPNQIPKGNRMGKIFLKIQKGLLEKSFQTTFLSALRQQWMNSLDTHTFSFYCLDHLRLCSMLNQQNVMVCFV